MIGNALRIDIEQWVAGREEKPLYAHAKAGTMTSEMLGRYLASLHFMILHTPIHLTRAAARARVAGDETLANHFVHKMAEEVGHEVWAEKDLEVLEQPNADVMPAARELARAIEAAIEEEPALYLSYIAFVEYMTVMVGAEWTALLHDRCGIPRNAVTVVDSHVELDREHAEEGFSVMDDLIAEPSMLPRMRAAMERFMALFDAYSSEAMVGVAIPAASESGVQLRADVVRAAVA